MIKCVIHCSIPDDRFEEAELAIKEFAEAAAVYGFGAGLSRLPGGHGAEAAVTLAVDDERIEAMKGAKRGPKEKATRITIDEMLSMKRAGRPPKEIAELAGISIATYFRRMAACKNGGAKE